MCSCIKVAGSTQDTGMRSNLPNRADNRHWNQLADGAATGRGQMGMSSDVEPTGPTWTGCPEAPPAGPAPKQAASWGGKQKAEATAGSHAEAVAARALALRAESGRWDGNGATSTGDEACLAEGGTDSLAQAAASGWMALCDLSHGRHEDLDEHLLLLARQRCR